MKKDQLRQVIPLPASCVPCSRSSQRVKHEGQIRHQSQCHTVTLWLASSHSSPARLTLCLLRRASYRIDPWLVLQERNQLLRRESDFPAAPSSSSSCGSDIDVTPTARCPSECRARWSAVNNCNRIQMLRCDSGGQLNCMWIFKCKPFITIVQHYFAHLVAKPVERIFNRLFRSSTMAHHESWTNSKDLNPENRLAQRIRERYLTDDGHSSLRNRQLTIPSCPSLWCRLQTLAAAATSRSARC